MFLKHQSLQDAVQYEQFLQKQRYMLWRFGLNWISNGSQLSFLLSCSLLLLNKYIKFWWF